MSNNETPEAPKIFDHVERYVSNLPVERVKDLNGICRRYLDKIDKIELNRELTTEEAIIIELAGYILELTN